jgi:hypothetical protein
LLPTNAEDQSIWSKYLHQHEGLYAQGDYVSSDAKIVIGFVWAKEGRRGG